MRGRRGDDSNEPRKRPSNPLKRKGRNAGMGAVVFDESSRKEFVTGFRKRKLQRREKAQKEIQERVKEAKLNRRAQRRDKDRALLDRVADIRGEVRECKLLL